MRLSILAALILGMFSAMFAQPVKTDDEKNLIQKEIERYKTRFFAQQTVLSDIRYDVIYYKLDITVTASPNYVRGNVLMRALSKQDGLSTITLDLMDALTVDSVLIGMTKVTFTQFSESFNVTLDHAYNNGELFEVQVFYKGVPGSSGFGSFEFSTHAGTPWIWSLSEPYGAKDWWPCKDHPSDKADSADIYVTCSSSYKVGSNGILVSVTNNGNGTSTHYWKERYPIPTYLISIAITNFSSFSNWFKYSPTDSMEVLNYVLPEHLSSAQANLPRTIDMLQIYSDLFGLYPFITEKYGHSEFGWGGGMEHQTMTSLSGFSEGLVAHELAHQWFGDMITCKTWPNIWLNEGFATYLTGLYYERKYGTASYWSYMNSEMSSAKGAVGSVYVADTGNVGTLFDGSLVYAKGATVLHMLRHVMGDTNFFHAMYDYANDPSYKYGTAVTEDFQAVCEAAAGTDLDYFFNEWVYGEKYPNYLFNWVSTPSSGNYDITVNINQSTGTLNPVFFTMPIDIKFSAAGWDTTITVLNNQQSQQFNFTLSHEPTLGQLDPENWILRGTLKPFSLSPSSLAMGLVYVGTEKRDSITMTNNSSGPVVISSALSDLPQLMVTPSSATVPGNGSVKFYITFKPTADGAKTGHIIFTHNAGSPDQMTVTAIGYFPRMTLPVVKNWNLVSLPLKPTDSRKSVIYLNASSNAFIFSQDSGYVSKDSLEPGKGYWVKFSGAGNVTYIGTTRTADTIDVQAGWNLIGNISSTIAAGSIISNPPGIIQSSFFNYANGYYASDSLKPAYGYWVNVNQDGVLILGSTVTEKNAAEYEQSQQELWKEEK